MYIILNLIFPVVQPTEEECAVATVGHKEWFSEESSSQGMGEIEEEKKMDYDPATTGVVSV